MFILIFRLLSLLAQFVIKLIKQYGMQQYGVLSSKNYNKNDLQKIQKKYSSLPHMSYNLHEMSRFLEVTRKMQSRLQIQRGRPQAGKVIFFYIFALTRNVYVSELTISCVDV